MSRRVGSASPLKSWSTLSTTTWLYVSAMARTTRALRSRRAPRSEAITSDPAPSRPPVAEVLVAEQSFEVALLAHDYSVLHEEGCRNEHHERPRRLRRERDSDVGDRHAQIRGIAAEPVGPVGSQRRRGPIRIRIGADPLEGSLERDHQHHAGDDDHGPGPLGPPRKLRSRQQPLEDEAEPQERQVDDR